MRKVFLAVVCLILMNNGLAKPMNVNCVLNSPCTFSLYGQFNKIVHTYDIKPSTSYQCIVLNGVGEKFRISDNVQPSPGVTYSKGDTFATPLIIHGPKNNLGSITYTLNNRNKKIWQKTLIRYECYTLN